MHGNTWTLLSVLFLVLSIFRNVLCHYTEYPPVKLLSVDSIADRYKASYSEYRTKTERCHVRNQKNCLWSWNIICIQNLFTISKIFCIFHYQLGRRLWSYRWWYIKWIFDALSCLRARWACILPSSSEIRSNFCSHCPSKEAWGWRVISKLLQQGRTHNWCGKYRVSTPYVH